MSVGTTEYEYVGDYGEKYVERINQEFMKVRGIMIVHVCADHELVDDSRVLSRGRIRDSSQNDITNWWVCSRDLESFSLPWRCVKMQLIVCSQNGTVDCENCKRDLSIV